MGNRVLADEMATQDEGLLTFQEATYIYRATT